MYTLIRYNKNLDEKLMRLFYRSLFFSRDEIEYVKEPTWIWRYRESKKYIRILSDGKNPVGSLGAIPTTVKVNDKMYKVAVIVDNCIEPGNSNDFERIFSHLFDDLLKSLEKDGFDIIALWDYEAKFNHHKLFYNNLNFRTIKNVNWSIAGIEYNHSSPKKWRGKNQKLIKLFYHYLKLSNKFTLNRKIQKRTENLKIRHCTDADVQRIINFISKIDTSHRMLVNYSKHSLNKLRKEIGLDLIIAELDNDIVGVISYFISPWTGMMYGKPIHDDWEKFYTLTIDEFIVDDKLVFSEVPALLIEELIKVRQSHHRYKIKLSGMIVDLVDREDEFRHTLYKKYGFMEPSFDKGLLLVRKINNRFPIDSIKSWHLPNRMILAPIPEKML